MDASSGFHLLRENKTATLIQRIYKKAAHRLWHETSPAPVLNKTSPSCRMNTKRQTKATRVAPRSNQTGGSIFTSQLFTVI